MVVVVLQMNLVGALLFDVMSYAGMHCLLAAAATHIFLFVQ